MAKKGGDKKKRSKDRSKNDAEPRRAPAASGETAGAGGPQLLGILSHAQRASRAVLSRHLTAFGLYAGQDAVMLLLDETEGQALSVLAARLGVRAPTVTKTVNRLAAEGFVEKRASDSDGRQTLVHLTPAGRQAIDSIRAAVRASEADALAGFSDKEARTLVKLLRKVDANLQAAAPANGGSPVAAAD